MLVSGICCLVCQYVGITDLVHIVVVSGETGSQWPNVSRHCAVKVVVLRLTFLQAECITTLTGSQKCKIWKILLNNVCRKFNLLLLLYIDSTDFQNFPCCITKSNFCKYVEILATRKRWLFQQIFCFSWSGVQTQEFTFLRYYKMVLMLLWETLYSRSSSIRK